MLNRHIVCLSLNICLLTFARAYLNKDERGTLRATKRVNRPTLLATVSKHYIGYAVTWLIDDLRSNGIAVFIKGVEKVSVADIATAVTVNGTL